MTENNQSESNERTRFMNALPFYVNGTSTREENDWLERYLQLHPELLATLEWHKRVQQHVLSTEAELISNVPDNIGVKGLQERLAARRKENKLLQWWSELSSARWLPTAFAGLAIVVVMQSTILGLIVSKNKSGEVPYEPVIDQTRSSGSLLKKESISYLQINVKSDTKESDFRVMLIGVGGRIIDGPGQYGDYIISVPSKHFEAAKNKLTSSPLLESIRKLDRLPQHD